VWSVTNVNQATKLSAVTAGNGQFVAAGDNNRIFVSPDGLGWNQFGKVFNNANGAAIGGLSFKDDTFVAVAKAPAISLTGDPIVSNWPSARIQQLSFAESYRGVARYRDGSFLACGIFGVARISEDFGNTWDFLRPIGRVGAPDFFGIAGDPAGHIVAVGGMAKTTNGVIHFASGREGTLASVYTNPVPNNPFNGVFNTGNGGFIAVGHGGAIVTSSDGQSWFPGVGVNDSQLPSADLFGVTFATNGFMRQVGILVGAEGTVIIAAEPPPRPLSLGDHVGCAGSNNGPFPLDVSVANSLGADIVTVDWFANPEGGIPIRTGTTQHVVGAQAPNISTTNTYWAEARDLRTGFVSTNRTPVTLVIHERPTAVLISTNTICNGGGSYITGRIDKGSSPWAFVITNQFASYSFTIETNSALPITFVLPLDAGTAVLNPTNSSDILPLNIVWGLQSLVDRYCYTNICTNCTAEAGDLGGQGRVIVNPRPKAFVTTTNAICDSLSAVIDLQLRGTGPWTVYWSDGATQNVDGSGIFNTNRTVSPPAIDENSAQAYPYSITKVVDRVTLCETLVEDLHGVAQITVYPKPISRIITTNTICNGSSITLTAALSGTGPWTLTWSDGFPQTTNGSPAVRTVNPTNTNPDASATFTYTITNLVDAHCAATNGGLRGMASVVVNPRARALMQTNLTLCNGRSADLHVILNGIAPWTVEWSDGFMQQVTNGRVAVRTVTPTNSLPNSPITTNYSVATVSDSNGCVNLSGDVQTLASVTVNPRPTASVSGASTACSGETNTIRVDLTGVPPWVIIWSDGFRQTNATSPALRLVAPTNRLANEFTNFFYAVTNVGDINSCPNEPGDISGLAQVIVAPLPTASVVTTNTSCSGEPVTVRADLTGLGPWLVMWSDGSNELVNASPTFHIVNPTNSLLNALTTNTYTVTNLIDSGVCSNTAPLLFGTARVMVYPVPSATLANVNTVLCYGSTNFVATVTMTGVPPFSIEWSDGVIQTSNTATIKRRLAVPNNESTEPVTNVFSLVTATNFDCAAPAGNVSGRLELISFPRVAAVLSGSTNHTVTDTEPVTSYLTVNLSGVGPWELTWSDGLVEIATNTPWERVLTTNHLKRVNGKLVSKEFVYTLDSVLGSNGCAAAPANISGQAIVRLVKNPTGFIFTASPTNICRGQTVDLQLSLEGTPNWVVTISNTFGTTNIIVVTNPNGEAVITVAPTNTTTFTIVALKDDRREATASDLTGSVTVNVTQIPSVAPASGGDQTNYTCSGTNAVISVITAPFTSANWYATSNGGVPVATNTSSFTPVTAVIGTNSFYASLVTTNGCEGTNRVRVNLIVLDCPTLSIAKDVTNGITNVIISWTNNFHLRSTTNLIEVPVNWVHVSNGAPNVINRWTNAITPYNELFFRLFPPAPLVIP
jgi:hypothetical protein